MWATTAMRVSWLTILLHVHLVDAVPRLWGITYRSGSLNGATRIYLSGQEFSSEHFNSPIVGNGDKGNKVWLRSATAAVECDVIPYLTNRNRIACDTRPAPEGTYNVDVEVDGEDVEKLSGYSCSGCTFQYTERQTPTITSVTPASGTPGSLVTIKGKLFTAKVSDTEPQEDTSKDDREIQRVYWGSYICDTANETGHLYGISLDRDGQSLSGSLKCKPRGTYIASQPMSFLVSKNYGSSRPNSESLRISGRNELYHFQSHAVIHSIAPTDGSTAGGTLVTITGDYFDTDTAVLIGGVPCTVINSTRTTIECLTGPSNSDMTAYPGERGMNEELWTGSSYVRNLDVATFNESASDFLTGFTLDASMSDSGSFGESLGERFIGRLRGFYVPPRDGEYMFSMACDDESYLALSNSSKPEDKVQIAICPSHGRNYHAFPEATSSKISLEGGKHYYMEANVQNRGGTGYANIGVHMYDAPFGKRVIESAFSEKQKILVKTVEQSEVQVLRRPADIPEVQVLRVAYDGNCTSNETCPRFTLSFEGQETGELTANVDPVDMESALNALASIQTIGVDVSISEEEGNGTYIISFRDGSANLPEIVATVKSGSANITVEERQQGVPNAFTDSFSIELDGVASSRINFTKTAEEVQDIMTDMLTVKCGHTSSGGSYIYEQDFEGPAYGTEYGERTSEARPFCGRQSLKNPEYVFLAGTTGNKSAFNALYNRQLCFGYRGSLSGSIELRVVWVDQEKKKSRDDTVTIDDLFFSTVNWQHTCINLKNQIESTSKIGNQYVSSSGLSIESIKLLGDPQNDFYIDNLHIGSSEDSYEPGAPAPTPNDIFIVSIVVEKPDDDSFRFTLTPANCKSGFPLMGVRGAEVVNDSSASGESVVYMNSNWPANASLEVLRAEAASPAIGGTFDLIQNGGKIEGISVSVSASTMKRRLEAYFDVGTVEVERSGSCSGSYWNVTWMTKGGLQPLIEVDDSRVTGHMVYSSSERLEEGRVFLGPIPGEFLRTFHYTPQVEVLINGIPSSCDGNCSFEYSSESTPVLTDVSPTTGTGCAGTSITLSGAGFSTSASENKVSIGGADCAITASSENSITCTVGAITTGEYKVLVTVDGRGHAAHLTGDILFTHELDKPTFSPSEGSTAGGTVIRVSGCGFSDVVSENNVTVDGRACNVTDASHLEIVCVIEIDDSGSTDASGPLVLVVNNVTAQSSGTFSFSSALTPTITGISPNSSSVLGGGNLTLTGTSFTTSDAAVKIGGLECEVLSQTDTEVVCSIPAHQAGSYNVELTIGNIGFADVQAVNKFKYLLKVGGVFPSHGSTMGGTLLSIRGQGFGDDPGVVSVDLGDSTCEVQSVADEEINCLTTSPTEMHRVANDGSNETYGIGYQWNPQVLKIRAGDTVTWEWAVPSQVQDVVCTVQQTAEEDSLDYDGTGFRASTTGSEGSYSYTFTAPGTYYYSSGLMNQPKFLYMNGVIHVHAATSVAHQVEVTVGGHAALHSPETDSASASDSCTVSSGVDGCDEALPQGPDPALLYFSFYECSSPMIHSISPLSGTSEDEVVITGEGFGDAACQHDLRFGDHPCAISAANSTSLICTLDTSGEPTVSYWMEVSLTVKNLGAAGTEIESLVERSFTLKPYIGSISHTMGSTAGGLTITLTGTGFSAPDTSSISVAIGGAACDIESFNYTTIACTTGPNPAGNYPITVTVSASPAVVDPSVTFNYSTSATATLTSVSPTSFVGTATLTIEGANFPSTANDITVTVGGVDCSVTSVTTNDSPTVICDVGYVPAGSHDVLMNIVDQGAAEPNGDSTRVESEAILTDVTPNLGGKHGGQLIMIRGNGFVEGDTQVIISGEECPIQSLNESVVRCVTPKIGEGMFNIEVTSSGVTYNTLPYVTSTTVTPKILSANSTAASGDTITIQGLRFIEEIDKLQVTIGDVACEVTSASAESVQCTLGEHSAGTYPIMLLQDNFGYANDYVNLQYALRASASPIECGFGGGITLTITGAGFHENGTVVLVCDQPCPTLSVTASEITCEVPAVTAPGATQVCDVIVSLPEVGVNATVSDVVTYRESLTSYITDVSPRRGGTGGGTNLTITGTRFASSGNEVTIAGTTCDIQSESTTEIICRTGAHSLTEMAKVRVVVGASGIATQDNADFFYIDVWSSVYTWGGHDPPGAGDLVVIPAGKTILLDESTHTLGVLLLQGGHMVFDEKDLELHAEYIIITDGGSLTVGTEEEPFQHQATIMMHGHVRSQELPMFGAKVLAVRNGTLDLHGKPVAVTWTHLATTVNPGDTTMTLKQPVDWNVDDQIVIATTGHRHSQVESEMLTITGVSADNMTLTFTPALEHKHISMVQTIDGVTLETRAEVGLLTRNVKFRGSVQDEWTEVIAACDTTFDTNQFAKQTCFQGRFGEETGSDQYGAHIMLFAKEMDQDWIVGRISYIEVTHAGQAFRLGRYPIHFHMSGDITGSYVRGCGIYNTFNRAVTVHGVHGFVVEHNVAYNIMGHAFFLEDGIESGNTLQYNLAVFIRPSSSLLNVDITPAAYWITNPNNTVRHNAAAGGSHFGFWYNAPKNPGGPSYTPDIFPRNLPLGEFRNNSAHSQGWYGIWIFPIYYPSEPAKFESLTAWEVERGAEATEVGRVQFHNFLISDAEASGLEYQTVAAPWGESGAYINNSVIIGYSDLNDNDANGECTNVGIQLPKSRYLTVDGVKFINFDRSCTAFEACGHCKIEQGGFEHRMKNLVFTNTPNIASFKWEHETWFEDLDGTLTGAAGNILLPQTSLLPPAHCQLNVGHSSGGAVPGAVCDTNVKMHRMAWNGISPSSLKYKNVILENANGNSSVPYHKKRLTHSQGWMATVIEGDSMNMWFENVDHITNISYDARFDQFGDGEYVLITHNFTQEPDVVSLVGTKENLTDDQLDPLTSSHGDFTFDNDTKEFTYIVTGNGAEPANKFIELDVYRCYYQDCITPRPAPPPAGRPTTSALWSDINSWDGLTELPTNGDNVQIPPGVWMVADVPLPWMNELVIYGTLEIPDTQDQVINATHIFIHGGRLVAGFDESAPFMHNLHILLRGDHSTPDMPLPNGPNMGSKVIGVFGELNLHGVQRNVSWTQLAAEALPGSDTIELVEATDWTVGDKIVVTTTSYEAWQTETFKIKEKVDDYNFILNGTFTYKHTASTHRLSDGSAEYTTAAEVGLLTRNILIEGADYPDLFEESFGARVLVGRFNQDGEEFVGYARVSNVEFKHSGQEGWTDFYDPRYSLAFLDAGEVVDERPSYVKGCSFHNGFSTAIGIYGTHSLNVSDNVIHHVVGPGIVSWGDDTRLVHNLVSLVIFPGMYQDRYEPENLLMNGGIEVEKATRPFLENNTVAGSERVGYKVKGEPCDESLWYGNTAHSTFHGIHMFSSSQPECSQISSFYIWNSYDYGIYAQIKSSLLVTDSTFVDNTAGLMALITEPAALSHIASSKFVEVRDSVFVGTSPSFDCDAVAPEVAPEFSKHHPPTASSKISTLGFYIPTFMSSKNGAPFKPFSRVNNYPAINGISRLTGVTFANYGSACGDRHVAIMTSPESHDATHPLVVQSLRLVDVEEDNRVFMHYPSLSKVNPADCVDMDCDGMKKVLVRDRDGSLLGSVGTVIPKAEYEWDGDPRRGLGDYRIPRTMLTAQDGSRIEADDLAANRGIYRGSGSDCEWHTNWQAYECHNLDHMMMVIESLDADTETRRVSPVGLQGGNYLDLINGPQDNGWCHGYTCQERISTFYALVETGLSYRLDFTGTNPQQLRYHLIHAETSQSVVVSTYYTNPQRLDIYVNGLYVLPTNGVLQNGEFTWKAPEAGETKYDYYPSLASTVPGENYFDRELNLLIILIRGSTPVDVVTSPVVMTTFGVPATAVDNFFEENLVQNLAALLNIPASKIRVVEIIAEDSRRRRRAAGEAEVLIEIGNSPASSIATGNGTNTAEAPTTVAPGNGSTPLSFEDLQNCQSILVDEMQTGGLEDKLGTPITFLAMTDPVDTPVDPTGGVRATNQTGGSANETGPRYDEVQAMEEAEDQNSAPMEYRAPSRILVVEEPGDAKEGHPFLTQPKLKVVDASGNIVENLGHSSNPWRLEVTLRINQWNASITSENATHSFKDGWLNFTDLAVSTTGTGFLLDYTIVHPNSTGLTATSAAFEVKVRPMGLRVVSQLTDVIVGDTFDIAVQLFDILSGDNVTDLAAKGLDSWVATASLYMPGNYRGHLEGDLSATFDLSTGRATFNDLALTSTGVSYLIRVDVHTTPESDYDFVHVTEAIDAISRNRVTYSQRSARLTLRFNADYRAVAAGQEESLTIYFLNQIAPDYKNATFSNVNIWPGSILIAFDVTGDVESVQVAMWEDLVLGQLVLNYNGQSIPADTFLLVDGENYTGHTTSATGFPIWIIILIIIIVILLVVIIIVTILILSKKGSSKIDDYTTKIVSATSSVVELNKMGNSDEDNQEKHCLSRMTPSITVDNDDNDTQNLLSESSSRDDLSSVSKSPRLNKPRRSPELAVTSLPPGFTEGQYVYEKDDFEELSVMVRNPDGTFQELGKVMVNMVGTIQDVREELRGSGLPPKVRDRPFILLDEQLQGLTPEKEKQLVASEVYAGRSVLIKWVLDEDSENICICGLVGQFSCALCHKQSYCSPLCQSKDWPQHSVQCEAAQNDEI